MKRGRFDEVLARLHGLFTRAAPPPREWLRDGALRPLLIPLIAGVAFLLAGPVRYFSDLNIMPSLVPAAYLLIAISAPLWPTLFALRPGAKLHVTLGLLCAGLLAGGACYVLYNHYFAGLTNYRGTDGSFHVFYYHQFIRTEPGVYQGFNVTYAALYFVQQIFRCNVFWAFCIIFYSEVAIVSALPMVITFSLLWPLRHTHRAAYAAGVVLAPLTAAVVAYYCVLPEQHVYQADGFFPQLFGLLPLFALWLIDALVVSTPLRLLYLLLTLVLFRFTYALNIGDVTAALVVIFALALLDAQLRLWLRIAAALIAVALGVVTRDGYRLLWLLRNDRAHFLGYYVEWLNAGLIYGIVLMLLVVVASVGRRPPLPDRGFARAARFPLLFSLASLGMVLAIKRSTHATNYYCLKYPFYALVLLAAACVAIVPAVVAHVLAAWRGHRARVQLALVGLTSVYFLYTAAKDWHIAITPHWRGFAERAWSPPPYWKNEDNLPLADLGAFRRIPAVLQQEHKKFAGYLMSQFGMMMFTNAAFDVPHFGWPIWFANGGLRVGEPNSCFFWDEGTSHEWLVWESGYFVLRDLRRSLILDGNKTCQWYHAHWDPEGPPRTLCHMCWDEKGRVSPPR